MGLLNPWVILGIVVFWVASLGAVGWKAHEIGHDGATVAWQAKDNEELRLANVEILRLTGAARTKEQEHATEMATQGADYEKKLAAARLQRDRDRADIRAGAIQLRIAAARICPGASPPSEAGPAGGQRDGAETVELPREIASDLFDLANDADQVADQLRACQGVILSDRKAGP